jgi:hypothetical protein
MIIVYKNLIYSNKTRSIKYEKIFFILAIIIDGVAFIKATRQSRYGFVFCVIGNETSFWIFPENLFYDYTIN